MNTQDPEWRAQVLKANQAVHGKLATVYDETEPHFRPENQAKVKARLQRVRDLAPGHARMLDVGCGTGFMLRQAVGLFDQIDGVDITPEMMARIPDLGPSVRTQIAEAEQLPFEDATFDVVTAYSVFDHLVDYRVTIREILRVLKSGGIFYADLIPNRGFWRALVDIPVLERGGLSDIVGRELAMVLENDKRVEAEYGIESEVFRNAEPGKLEGGIDGEAVVAEARAAGFSNPTVHYDWFLGQGAVMHQQSFAAAETVEAYLHRLGPLGRPLFKYVYFLLQK
jgi:SAM-dependent methyltransferase